MLLQTYFLFLCVLLGKGDDSKETTDNNILNNLDSNEPDVEPSNSDFVVGCPVDLNLDVKGLPILINGALKHVENERDKVQALVEVTKLQRQIVVGIKHILTLKIASTICSKETSKADGSKCPLMTDSRVEYCEVEYFEQPWINKEKNIVSNNCTKSQHFTLTKDLNTNVIGGNTDSSFEYESDDTLLQKLPCKREELKHLRSKRSVRVDDPTVSVLSKREVRGGRRTILPINDRKIVDLVYRTLKLYDDVSGERYKHKAEEITGAMKQRVEGTLYRISLTVILTNCLKSVKTHPKNCRAGSNAKAKSCNIIIWDRPWLKHGRQTNITCDGDEIHQFRSRRNVISPIRKGDSAIARVTKREVKTGGKTKLPVDDPDVITLAYFALRLLDGISREGKKRKVKEILSAYKQIVAGEKYDISLKSVLTVCPKYSKVNPEDCDTYPEPKQQSCKIVVWNKPYPNYPRETNISCGGGEVHVFRTNEDSAVDLGKEIAKRAVEKEVKVKVGGWNSLSVDNPEVIDMAYYALNGYDNVTDDVYKLKVKEILRADIKIVAGYLYNISLTAVRSDCLKKDRKTSAEDCGNMSGAPPINCDIRIWDQLGMWEARHTDIHCIGGKSHHFVKREFRTPHSYATAPAAVLGGRTKLPVDDPEVISLAYFALYLLDTVTKDNEKLKVKEILSAYKQIVAGERYDISLTAVLTTCGKLAKIHPRACQEHADAKPKSCEITVWNKPYPDHPRETTIDCGDGNIHVFRTKGLFAPGLAKEDIHHEVRHKLGGWTELKVDDPKVIELAYFALNGYDSVTDDVYKLKVEAISSASRQIVAGALYAISLTAVRSDCLKKDKTSAKNCKSLLCAPPTPCNITMWDQVWIPHERITNITCAGGKPHHFVSEVSASPVAADDSTAVKATARAAVLGGRTKLPVDDPEVITLAYFALYLLDTVTKDNEKQKVKEILSAYKQIVAGERYDISLMVVLTRCGKLAKIHPRACQEHPDAKPKSCEITVWNKPYSDHPRETTIFCGGLMHHIFRTKGVIPQVMAKEDIHHEVHYKLGGRTELKVDDPKVIDLAYFALNGYDSVTDDVYKLKVEAISSAYQETVAGTIYGISLTAVRSDCLKKEKTSAKNCKNLLCAPPTPCNVTVWDRAWLPHGRVTNINCAGGKPYYFVSEVPLLPGPGGKIKLPVDDPEVITLAYFALYAFDTVTKDNEKLKVKEILSAYKQIVAGELYGISLTAVLTTCSKLGKNIPKGCPEHPDTKPKSCEVVVWNKPHPGHPRETNISCDAGEVHTFRTNAETAVDLGKEITKRALEKEEEDKKRIIGKSNPLNVDNTEVIDMAYYALDGYDTVTDDVYKLKVKEILWVDMLIDDGQLYKISLTAVRSDCLKKDKKTSAKDCGNMPGAPPINCDIRILERPWTWEKRITDIHCIGGKRHHFVEGEKEFPASRNSAAVKATARPAVLGGRTKLPVDDPEVIALAYFALYLLDTVTKDNEKQKVKEILSAYKQIVAGERYDISLTAVLTTCGKLAKIHPRACQEHADAKPKSCEVTVWNKPYPDHPRETTIDCGDGNIHVFRTKGLLAPALAKEDIHHEVRHKVGGWTKLKVDDPKVIELAYFALNGYDSVTDDVYKLKVEAISSASRQIVAGALYSISLTAVRSDCLKKDKTSAKNCKSLLCAPPTPCNITMWDQVWIPHERITNITCAGGKPHHFVSEVSASPVAADDSTAVKATARAAVLGGRTKLPVDDPEVITLAYFALYLLDTVTKDNEKQKVKEILSAYKQIVAGERYDISLMAVLTSCGKLAKIHPRACQEHPDAKPKSCEITVWNKPYSDHPRETTIFCGGLMHHIFRTKGVIPQVMAKEDIHHEVHYKLGGRTELKVDDPKVIELAYFALNGYDSVTDDVYKLNVEAISSAYQETVAGTIYGISLTAVRSDCLKKEKTSAKNCKNLLCAPPTPCNVTVWDRVWLPHGRVTNINCAGGKPYYFVSEVPLLPGPGGKRKLPVDDPEVITLAYFALYWLDSVTKDNEKLKVKEISSAYKQIVAGELYGISLTAVLTTCSKLGKNIPKGCPEHPDAKPKSCEVVVWNKPYPGHPRETNISCDAGEVHTFRSEVSASPVAADDSTAVKVTKREAVLGGRTKLPVDDPEVIALAYFALYLLDTVTKENEKQKVKEILSAYKQIVAGERYDISLTAVLTTCGKLAKIHPRACQEHADAKPKSCEVTVWNKPYPDHPRETTIDCGDGDIHVFRTKGLFAPGLAKEDIHHEVRRKVGGWTKLKVDDPKVIELAYFALNGYDSVTDDVYKLKVEAISSASEAIAVGTIYEISLTAVRSDCLKKDKTSAKNCKNLLGAPPTACNITIWDQVWLPQGRTTNITCAGGKSHHFVSEADASVPGGTSKLPVDDPQVITLAYYALYAFDTVTKDNEKLKVKEISWAFKSNVAGEQYEISLTAVLTTCSKLGKNSPRGCPEHPDAKPKDCMVRVWNKSYPDHLRETNISCDGREVHTFRTNEDNVVYLGKEVIKREVHHELGDREKLDINDTLVLLLAYRILHDYDNATDAVYTTKVAKILSAYKQTGAGTLYSISLLSVRSSCLVRDDILYTHCGAMVCAPSIPCDVYIWTNLPWAPTERVGNITCAGRKPYHFGPKAPTGPADDSPAVKVTKREAELGGRTKLPVDDPEVVTLATSALYWFDTETNDDGKLKVKEILSAYKQIVAGERYDISLTAVLTTCSKLAKILPLNCEEVPDAKPKSCEVTVWNKPLPDHPREMNISCDGGKVHTFRSKGDISVAHKLGRRECMKVDDPIVIDLAHYALAGYIGDEVKHKYNAKEIFSASRQAVAGTLYLIILTAIRSDCLKRDNTSAKNCGFVPCRITIWDRPWLPHGRVTNVKCTGEKNHHFVSKRSVRVDDPTVSVLSKREVRGGRRTILPINDRKIVDLVYRTLKLYDDVSGERYKHKAEEITGAMKQRVEGTLYRISLTVILTNCLKSVKTHPKNCRAGSNAKAKSCNIIIWDRPWLKHGRQTNITCDGDEIHQFRSRRNVISPIQKGDSAIARVTKREVKTGGKTKLPVDDPDVITLAYFALRLLDGISREGKKRKVKEILSAYKQIVAGEKYDISLKSVLTVCPKYSKVNPEDCDTYPEPKQQSCKIVVWNKPYPNYPRETNISCGGGEVHVFRTIEYTAVDLGKEIAKRAVEKEVKEKIGGWSSLSVDNPEVIDMAYYALNGYDNVTDDVYKLKVKEILRADMQIVAGYLYNISLTAVRSDCLKKDRKTSAEDCGNMPGAPPINCDIRILDQLGIWKARHTDIHCIGGKSHHFVKREFRTPHSYATVRAAAPAAVLWGGTKLPVDDPEAIALAYFALYLLDTVIKDNEKLKVKEILSAYKQIVPGVRYDIFLTTVLTRCGKLSKIHPRACQEHPDAEPKYCEITVEDKPYPDHPIKTTIYCDHGDIHVFRTKGVVVQTLPKEDIHHEVLHKMGGKIQLKVDDPKVIELAYFALNGYDSVTDDVYKFKVEAISSASKQIVAGALYKISLTAVRSDCLKKDKTSAKNCKNLLGAPPTACNITIWDQVWLPQGRTTNITCAGGKSHHFVSEADASVPGGITQLPVDDPQVITLAYSALYAFDTVTKDNEKLKVKEISWAFKSNVAGELYGISLTAVLTTCSKLGKTSPRGCPEHPDAKPKDCMVRVWNKSYPDHLRETNISCDGREVHTFRTNGDTAVDLGKEVTKREVHHKLGHRRQIDVNNTKVDLFVYRTLYLYDQATDAVYRTKAAEILSAYVQTLEGTLYSISLLVVRSACLVKDDVLPLYCDSMACAPLIPCEINVWTRAPWAPHERISNITCAGRKPRQFGPQEPTVPADDSAAVKVTKREAELGGRTKLPVDNPEVITLATSALYWFDTETNDDGKLKVKEILSAYKQIVAGERYDISLTAVLTTCSKLAKILPLNCEEVPDAKPKSCEVTVWNKPLPDHPREMNISCDGGKVHTFRSKGDISVAHKLGRRECMKVDDPIVIDLAHYALAGYIGDEVVKHKYNAIEILSASRQTVAGTLYSITLTAIRSDCLKKDNASAENCGFVPCRITIWDRPWLPHGRVTNVKCTGEKNHHFVSKRSLVLFVSVSPVPTDDPIVTELTENALKQFDKQSSHNEKHKVTEIVSATRKMSTGVMYNIDVKIAPINCTKSGTKERKECRKDHVPQFCKIKVWDRPWSSKGRETNITCGRSTGHRSRGSADRGGKSDFDAHLSVFADFKEKYRKNYGNRKEESRRFRIFRKNLAKIEKLNMGERGTAVYGITKFADLTYSEFSKRRTGLRFDLHKDEIGMAKAEIPDVELPNEFDWRKQNVVTEVKDQKDCGSCWAFSVTGNVEGQYAIKHKKLLEFSEQELVDCDKYDDGCRGGLMSNAYRAIEKIGGLGLESDYPYDAAKETCHFNRNLSKVQVSGAVNISHNENDMAKWLVQNGPISIGINANAMQFYVDGISHPLEASCNPKNVDHGVLIVGYGEHRNSLLKKTLPFWIVKNSWGKDWGEQGYYRVYRGDGTCGLNQTPSSAVLL